MCCWGGKPTLKDPLLLVSTTRSTHTRAHACISLPQALSRPYTRNHHAGSHSPPTTPGQVFTTFSSTTSPQYHPPHPPPSTIVVPHAHLHPHRHSCRPALTPDHPRLGVHHVQLKVHNVVHPAPQLRRQQLQQQRVVPCTRALAAAARRGPGRGPARAGGGPVCSLAAIAAAGAIQLVLLGQLVVVAVISH